MFREMRRKNQQLPHEEALAILDAATSGVLSVACDDGYPYGVPITHVRAGDKLYFHCATSGHKLDAIRNCDKACFTVIQQDELHIDEWTTYFRSVVCFGRVRIIDQSDEMRAAHAIMGEHFMPGGAASYGPEMEGAVRRMVMLEFQIEHITGKEAKELMAMRKHAQR